MWHTVKPGTPEHGTPEHPLTVAEQRNTPKYRWKSSVIPAEHLGTTEPYKTKNNCSDFKENLNLTLIHLTLSNQGGYIFYR